MLAFVVSHKTVSVLGSAVLALLLFFPSPSNGQAAVDDGQNCTFIADPQIGTGDCHAEIVGTAMWVGPGDFDVIDSTVYMVMGYGLQVMTLRDLALERKGRRYFMPDLYQVAATPWLLFTVELNRLSCYPRHGRPLLNKVLDEFEVEGNIIQLEVLDHYAYLLTHTELIVVDFVDPRHLEEVSQVPLTINTVFGLDMEVTPETVYIAAFELYAITDLLSDNPVVKIIDPAWYARSVSASGDRLWLLCPPNVVPTRENYLECYDISDPANPVFLTRTQLWADVSSIRANGDTLFLAAGETGVAIYDVSDPESPHPMHCFEPMGFAFGTYFSNGLLFSENSVPTPPDFAPYTQSLCRPYHEDPYPVTNPVGSDTCDFTVFDLTAQDEPELVGRYEHPGFSQEIFREGNTVWVRGLVGNVRTLTLGKHGRITEGPLLKTPGEPSAVCVHDGLLMTGSSYTPEVLFYDVSDPLHPELVSTIPFGAEFAAAVLAGHTAYRWSYGGGPYAFDITDPAAPRSLGRVNVPGLGYPSIYDDTLLYCFGNDCDISVFSLSDPDTLRLISSIVFEDENFRPYDMALGGSLLVVATRLFVHLIDLTDPGAPKRLPGFFLYDVSRVDLRGNRLYVLASKRIIHVYDISDPKSPREIGTYDTPGWACDVETFGNDLLIADGSGFLRIRPDMITSVVEDDPLEDQLPSNSRLHANYPNPFNSSTIISYALDRRMHVRMTIINTLGQTVAVLVDRELPAGDYTTPWDGRDDSGNDVATGVYFARLETEEAVESIKMVLLK